MKKKKFRIKQDSDFVMSVYMNLRFAGGEVLVVVVVICQNNSGFFFR